MNKFVAGMVGVAAGFGVSAASAQQSILTFGFDDLDGAYSTNTSHFTATGVDQGVGSPLRTTGNVSRLINPTATATYLPGTGAGRVLIDLAVSGIGPTSANGVGGITITDLDGDTLTSDINGQFISFGPAVFFNGVLSNVVFHDNGGQDGMFNGPSGGQFPLNFSPVPPPYTGAIVQLYIGDAGAFFTQPFSDIATNMSGAIIPGPSSMALLGLGLAVGGRRRRRA